ncbi:hypothetical protein GQ44DRAFT_822918 [Phaeosphaeriaceae sp. PMI808]|nr:hypothetical protein GQ44DRAFT_822918 [Phaeosphaeriaceae sp. PMI808]
MIVHGDMTTAGKSKPFEKTASKLIAVPQIPFRPKFAVTEPVTRPTLNSNVPSFIPSAGLKSYNTLPTSNSAHISKGNATETSIAPPGRFDWEFSVYNPSFILESWRMINMQKPRTVIKNISKHQIDYQKYVATFAGSVFLPEQLPAAQGIKQQSSQRQKLSAQSYLQHFKMLSWLEASAKELENENLSLYMVPLQQIEVNGQQLWKMTIPGLREDNPFLEMGDFLQLRQLWVDSRGQLMQVPVQTEASVSGHAVYYNRSWTGALHESCIYGINRAKEEVYVKAEGLMQLHLGSYWVPITVNVCFPPKASLLEGQKKALLYIGSELKMVAQIALESLGKGLIDRINQPIETKKTPNEATAELAVTPCNEWVRKILFPSKEDGLVQTRLRNVPHRYLFDSAINYEQAHAVNSICVNDYGTLPYLISGPPGTGKTKTLVETAMQLLRTTTVAHILICAPSEAAADTLAIRLKHYLNNKQLFRLNRPGRADNEVPGELTQYCYMKNDMFYLPPFKTMMAYNIVITSCQDAMILANARLTNNDLWVTERNMVAAFHPEDEASIPALHWGALLIDEAAQATEVNVLPAMQVICPPSAYPTNLTQPYFIMAGDENQLGPRTASHNPEFSTSLFARLFDRPLFTEHPLSRSNIRPSAAPPVLKKSMLPITYPPFTNLIRNYRSHPAILSVPSSLFYNNTLIPEAHPPPHPSNPPPSGAAENGPSSSSPTRAPTNANTTVAAGTTCPKHVSHVPSHKTSSPTPTSNKQISAS